MINANILYGFETAVGLGHQRRASGIVNGLVTAGFNTSVVSGSFVNPHDYFHPKAELIALPAHHRKKNGVFCHYDANNNLIMDEGFDVAEWRQQRNEAIKPFAASKPLDAVMIEWWPFNRRREFSGIVDTILETQEQVFGKKPLVISSVRDVLKFNDQFKDSHEEREVVDLINKKVDAVLMHSDPALFAFKDGFVAHQKVEKPVIYTGYVVNEAAKMTHMAERQKTVIVSCGSGDEGHHLLKSAFRAMPHSERLRDHEWHFVIGPRMEHHHREEFRAVADQVTKSAGLAFKPVIHEQLAELPKVLGEAGFSVSLAGYNTTMEVVASRVPAVLVPKFAMKGGAVDFFEVEQWKRLVRLRDEGLVSAIAGPKATMDSRAFAKILDDAYDKGSPSGSLDMNGAQKTAIEVARLIAERRPATYAVSQIAFAHGPERHASMGLVPVAAVGAGII